jgi:anti-sigma regulatory factor (Ser/Thr protein kinase)
MFHELLLIGAAPEAGHEAVRWVEGSCSRFGLRGPAVEQLSACVVEAVNNAIEHAYGTIAGDIQLTLSADRGLVTVVVADRGPGPRDHEVLPPEPDAPRGRGRWIMREWCDSVEHERGTFGFRTILTKQCASQAATHTAKPARTGSGRPS